MLPCLFTHFWQNKPLFILAVTIYLRNRGDMKGDARCSFLYRLDWLSCTTSHASLVGGGKGMASARVRYAQLACVCAPCMCAGCLRKTQTPTWVLKTMHILISLIIHPYVTDERILVSVSGAGNVRGGGRAKGGKGALQSPNDCVPAGVWTSPCAQRRARWDTHQDSPLWCGEELGKWTFSEYRIIRESSAPRQPSKVWIPQDSRDTLTGSQSLPSH